MAKQTLILVPGLLCNERLWRPQMTGLRDIADCHVSDAQCDHTNIPAIAAAILADAPPTFALAGLSFGGYICFEIMRQAPERVQRLALLDTSARPDSAEATAARRAMLKSVKIGKFTGVTDRLLASFIHPSRLQDHALVREVKAMTSEVGSAVFIRQQQAIMGRPDSRPTCTTIRCPTIILCGADDMMTPVRLHEEMHSLVPEASLHVIPHCGHLSTMERPERVNSLLREWLR